MPLDHGAFHWEGEIPETAHPGLVSVTMRGFEGTEVVAGITHSSVTVIGDVDVVYASREHQPPFLKPGDYNPLWGDLDTDVSAIEQLLKAITMGTVGSVRAEEGIAFSDHGLAVNVRFRDGTIWSVKQAIKCKPNTGRQDDELCVRARPVPLESAPSQPDRLFPADDGQGADRVVPSASKSTCPRSKTTRSPTR